MIDKAIEIYKKMFSEGTWPDNVASFTMVQACLIQYRHDFALDVILDALDLKRLNFFDEEMIRKIEDESLLKFSEIDRGRSKVAFTGI